ncbi:hypothetical protein [Timonella sp. A28]|uniref:hypothetical protein n=1 Tax=Timonella sp. A28 TaxID=3442640 RepID=UPI003EBA0274
MKVDFTIPMRDVINANQREHFHVRAKKTKTLRQLGKKSAEGLVFPDPCRIIAYFGFPDKRRRDLHNYFGTLKALIDGIVTDAKALPDDSWDHLIGPDLRVIDYKEKGHLYICLEIMTEGYSHSPSGSTPGLLSLGLSTTA